MRMRPNSTETGAGASWLRARAVSVAIAALLSATAFADRLTLSSGYTIEGMIVFEDENSVVFRDTSKMVCTLPKASIKSIERGESAAMLTQMGDDALKANDRRAALEHFRKAVAAGADEEALQPRMRACEQALEEETLGKWGGPVHAVRALLAQGKLDDAEAQLRLLESSVGEDHVDVRAFMVRLRGELHLARADYFSNIVEYERADEQLRKALACDPKNPDIHLEIAAVNERSIKTHKVAIDHYKLALENAGTRLSRDRRLETTLKIADLSQSLGDDAEAVKHYQIVFEEDADFRRDLTDRLIRSLTALAESGNVGNRASAVDSLRKAAAARPDSVEVHRYLGKLLLEEEKWDDAIEAYKRLLEISPEFKGANFALAKAYLGKRDLASAKTHFEAELVLDPRNYEAQCDLGDILWTFGDIELSQSHYEKARQIDPAEPRALVALASTDRRLGNYAKARKSIQEILDRYPRNIRANLEMGLCYLDEKKYQEAPPFLTKAVELVDQNGIGSTQEGRSFLADAYLARGAIALLTTGPGTATKDFNKALEVYPDYPAAHFSIGSAYQKKYSSSKSIEDLFKAETEMLKARELDPKNPEYALGLGVLYQNVLAAEDKENEQKYIQNAIAHYQDYVKSGGAQVDQVANWIRELGGKV